VIESLLDVDREQHGAFGDHGGSSLRMAPSCAAAKAARNPAIRRNGRHSAAVKPLDDVDHRLLALLTDNARRPLVALAKAVGLSRSAVQERLQRLERSGAIAGYTIRRGGDRAPPVQAWLQLRFKPGKACADVMGPLSDIEAVRVCHSVAGDIDLLVLLECAAIADVGRVRERIAALPEVASVTTLPVLAVQLDRG
jgi:DNA-binding Lrp family transcriptional regulator